MVPDPRQVRCLVSEGRSRFAHGKHTARILPNDVECDQKSEAISIPFRFQTFFWDGGHDQDPTLCGAVPSQILPPIRGVRPLMSRNISSSRQVVDSRFEGRRE